MYYLENLISKSVDSENFPTYTPLSNNLIWASFQLLFCFFLRPSDWKHHVAQIDPALPPDFTLTQLNRSHWRLKELRKMLLSGFVVWPGIAALVIGLIGLLFDFDSTSRFCLSLLDEGLIVEAERSTCIETTWIAGMMFGMGFGIIVGIMISWAESFPAGIVSCFVAALIPGLAWSTGSHAFLIVSLGITGGLVGNVPINILKNKKSNQRYWLRVGGGITGAVIAIFVFRGISKIPSLVLPFFLNDLDGFGSQYGLSIGIAGCTAIGLSTILRNKFRLFYLVAWVIFGILFGLSLGVLYDQSDLWRPFVIGSLVGLGGGVLFTLPSVVGRFLGGTWGGATAAALAGGGGGSILILTTLQWDVPSATRNAIVLTSFGCLVFAFTIHLWRSYITYPFALVLNVILYRLDELSNRTDNFFLFWHPVFWDEHLKPVHGLDDHLILVTEKNATIGNKLIRFLLDTSHSWAAHNSLLEFEARRLNKVEDLEQITNLGHSLAMGELGLDSNVHLRAFRRIGENIKAAQLQKSNFNKRYTLNLTSDLLDDLIRNLTLSSSKVDRRFLPIAEKWQELVETEITSLVARVRDLNEIDDPYIVGSPLTYNQPVFVGRKDIGEKIERIIRKRDQPPLLLYGQRRMGKTSLLNNLGRILPSDILPLFVDVQGPIAEASSHRRCIELIIKNIIRSAAKQSIGLPGPEEKYFNNDPFAGFVEWLIATENYLNNEGIRRIIICFDEFEAFNHAFEENRLSPEAILGTFRHIIQHLEVYTILFSGSHTPDEFKVWSTYLINFEIVHISYLPMLDAVRLIEEPMEGFNLKYEPNAVELILHLTSGHPYLIQLICSEIIEYKNNQAVALRNKVISLDVEAVVSSALERGTMFFDDIVRNQIDNEEFEILKFMSRFETESIGVNQIDSSFPMKQRSIRRLQQRELIHLINEQLSFSVILVKKWFNQLEASL